MDRKAQYSRNDLAVWYGLFVFVVALALSTVYYIHGIGDFSSNGQITALAIDDGANADTGDSEGVLILAEPIEDNSTIEPD